MTKREIEKLRRYRCAVITLAQQSAKRAIKRQFQAQGVRLGDLTAKQIAIWAHAWFESHSVELIAEAEHVIATSPYFECQTQHRDWCGRD